MRDVTNQSIMYCIAAQLGWGRVEEEEEEDESRKSENIR